MKTSARASQLALVPVLVVGALSTGCAEGERVNLGRSECGGGLYVAQGGDGIDNSHLWRLNVANDGRSPTSVADLGELGEALTGLAQHPITHQVFGVTTGNSVHPRSLVEVDLGGGGSRVVGELLRPGDSLTTVAEIEFDASGVLHGWSESEDRPVTIDLDTGAVTNLGPNPGISSYGDANGLYLGFILLSYLRGDGPLYFTDPSNGNTFAVGAVAFPATICGAGNAAMAGGTIRTTDTFSMFFATRIAFCTVRPFPADLTFFDLNSGETGVVAELPDQSDALTWACDPARRECDCAI